MEKNTVMTIDPSGKGTTGIFLISNNIISFKEYKSDNWEEHLNFIISLVQEEKPEIIVYETTNYIHKRMPGALVLLKLIGGIVGLKYTFNFVRELGSVAVNQIKPFKNKIFTGREQIENLTCQIGRGKGWKYKNQRISLHQLDALIIYHLWSAESLESTKSIKKKIIALKIKKRLGIRQKEKLTKLENFLVERNRQSS